MAPVWICDKVRYCVVKTCCNGAKLFLAAHNRQPTSNRRLELKQWACFHRALRLVEASTIGLKHLNMQIIQITAKPIQRQK